jgi:hypothetical protein
MDDARPESPTIEETDQRLKELVDPNWRGVQRDSEYEAARLFARMREFSKAARGTDKPLGFATFDEWIADFERTRNFSRTYIFNYAKVGRLLIPKVTEVHFKTLGISKAIVLARIEEAGRLNSDFVQDSLRLTFKEVREKAVLLLGEAGPWTERLPSTAMKQHKQLFLC